ncbi:MAG: tannase/feruloyl esterase family alpha/beta hydrolase [Gammaproteobacteria bacterium]|nr:tannase/feruloyl esterase family alpha/beta hydrolase [Gammaproteobacteria bacterium]
MRCALASAGGTRWLTVWAALGLLGGVGAVQAQQQAIQPACEVLAGLKLPHATVTSARDAPAESIAAAFGAPGRIDVPARCVVKVISRPSADSEIGIEIWLPLAGWNGKYLQVGNGGWSGAVVTSALAWAVQRGYATAGTDDGHRGSAAGGAQWAVGHPEKVIDFSYRALQETALLARQVVNAFYADNARRSYFVGCSSGGRQALMAAQRFPEIFDGIIAGAPAHNMTGLQAAGVWNEQALLKSPESVIPPPKLRAIQRAALQACDRVDGLWDGLIDDPRACRFDPAALRCTGQDSPQCLTAPQLAALRRVYAGPSNPRTGVPIYPGLAPGTEAVAGSWKDWLIATPPDSARQFAFGNAYFGQLVREGTGWNFRDLNFDTDIEAAYRKVGVLMDAVSPDLRSFRARGGKLIQYHGWGDAAIAPGSSVDYYEQVRGFFATYPDARAASARPVEEFYRLFMVPGMGHCGGGVGPGDFGNGAPVAGGPEYDIVAALDRWVERGVAPERLIGRGVTVGSPGKPLSRPICPYPRVARYLGRGEPTDAASFSCAPPAPR